MTIEVNRIFKFNGDGPVKGVCDIIIEKQFAIKGFRVVNGRSGLFVGMPREQGKDGKWYDKFSPLDEGTKQLLTETVLKAWQDEN